jgi:hypothetical protein
VIAGLTWLAVAAHVDSAASVMQVTGRVERCEAASFMPAQLQRHSILAHWGLLVQCLQPFSADQMER